MFKKLIAYYKIPLLISITLTVVLLAQGVIRNPIDITGIVIGCFLGTFVLDSEYILYAYIFEPESEYAKTIMGYIKYKDYKSLIDYINTHGHQLKDRALNSALFQVILAPICIFVVYASTSYFIKAFVLSIFANSIYKLIEAYFEGSTKEWFWAIKAKPNKDGVLAYTIGMVVILIFCLNLF